MIQLFSNRIITSSILSIATMMSFWFLLELDETNSIIKLLILLIEGALLDYFCFKYSLIGQKTHLPLLVFTVLSVLIVPDLSYADLIYGAVWLGSFFLAFEGKENPEKSLNYMIFLGILMGIAQAISSISIFLFLPIFILFIQSGIRSIKGFFLSILYFTLVIVAYVGILFVMDLFSSSYDLVPKLSLDYKLFDSILFKLFLPYVIISIVIHILGLNSYSFRFPNKSKILNYTLLIQAAIAILLIIVTAELDMMIYAIMSISILLSYAFAYKKHNTFVNAAFASLFTIALMSLYLYKTLIL